MGAAAAGGVGATFAAAPGGEGDTSADFMEGSDTLPSCAGFQSGCEWSTLNIQEMIHFVASQQWNTISLELEMIHSIHWIGLTTRCTRVE